VHSDRKFLSDYFPRSYAPLNLENSKYLLLSLWALLLKLLNRISLNLVVIMDIICKCAFDRKFRSHYFSLDYAPSNLYISQYKSEHAHIPHAPTYCTLKRDNSSMEHNSWKNQDIRISSQYLLFFNQNMVQTIFIC
jgi:hypothetical protein